MDRRVAEILRLQACGFSQDVIGRELGITQSRVSALLKDAGLSKPRKRQHVNRSRRDGLVVPPCVETWEPYRILHPTVAKLLSDRHFRPVSSLRVGGISR